MPELPEVESTVHVLSTRLSGLVVEDLVVTWPRTIEPFGEETLRRKLVGARVTSITRRAKYVLFHFSRQQKVIHVAAHLRMSGRMFVEDGHTSPEKHDRVILYFQRGTQCRFEDPRKFGRFTLLHPGELELLSARFGPEPLSDDFSSQQLFQILQARNRNLKTLLLDQSALAGLGNIYVDESLWEAKLHPLRVSSSVTLPETRPLYRAIRRILREAIRRNGTDFGDGVVHNGLFVPRVYGRAGEPCSRCGEVLERLIVSQRGTVVCNTCQS